MRHERASDLPKLGAREYVQGGTIFNGLLAVCDEIYGADWLRGARIPSFKLERESTANGRFVIDEAPIRDLTVNATFHARSREREIHAVYVDEGREFRREPYDEERFNQPLSVGTDLSGEFVLPAPRPRADFMKGVVGANKLVHQKADRFGGELKKIQFLYLKDLSGDCLLACDEELRLTICNLTVKETEREIWTINRVTVAGTRHSSELRLCYRAQRP